SSLRSRPHPALRATFSRKREKGCSAGLPLAGEGLFGWSAAGGRRDVRPMSAGGRREESALVGAAPAAPVQANEERPAIAGRSFMPGLWQGRSALADRHVVAHVVAGIDLARAADLELRVFLLLEPV